jgi:hypothetical protein
MSNFNLSIGQTFVNRVFGWNVSCSFSIFSLLSSLQVRRKSCPLVVKQVPLKNLPGLAGGNSGTACVRLAIYFRV